MIGQNKDLIGEQCVKDDRGNVRVDHGEIRNAWRSYDEHLLIEEFPWNRDILEAGELVWGPPPEIKNEWVKKAIDEMKNRKAASSTGFVYLGKKRQLYFIFVDLEKAFDRVHREVRKLRVEDWFVMTMYDGF